MGVYVQPAEECPQKTRIQKPENIPFFDISPPNTIEKTIPAKHIYSITEIKPLPERSDNRKNKADAREPETGKYRSANYNCREPVSDLPEMNPPHSKHRDDSGRTSTKTEKQEQRKAAFRSSLFS